MSSLIAEKIKQYRTKAGLSQQELAEKVDLSRPTISLIEQNKRKVSVEEMVRFCSVFDVTPSKLLEQEESEGSRDEDAGGNENILELYKEYKEKFQKKPPRLQSTNPLEEALREIDPPTYVPPRDPFYEIETAGGVGFIKDKEYEQY